VAESSGFFRAFTRAAGWVAATALTVGDNLYNAGRALVRTDADGHWSPDLGTAWREARSAALIGGGAILLSAGLTLAAPFVGTVGTFVLGAAGFLALPSIVSGVTGYQSQDGYLVRQSRV
jgi:hypothetical protein